MRRCYLVCYDTRDPKRLLIRDLGPDEDDASVIGQPLKELDRGMVVI